MNLRKQQIAALWNEGHYAKDIAKTFDVSVRYIFKVRKQLGLPAHKHGPKKVTA